MRGTLLFDERDLPVTDWDDQGATPNLARIDAFLSGEQLGRNGFVRPFQSALTLEVSCSGPWCAGALSDRDYIAFVEMRDDGAYAVQTNPCGGFLLPLTAEIEHDLRACMRGDPCDLPQD